MYAAQLIVSIVKCMAMASGLGDSRNDSYGDMRGAVP